MRYLSSIAVAALLAATIPLSLAVWRLPAIADDLQMTTCPVFTSAKWVSPMPPNDSGTQYQLTVTQNAMTCSQATTWAQKLIGQHMDGKPMQPAYPPLTGGPPGYVCKGSPDNTGHAYRGHCLKGSDPFAPGFNWSNHATP